MPVSENQSYKVLSLLPRQTIHRLVAQSLLSRDAANQALTKRDQVDGQRSATATRQSRQLTERDLVRLMETYEGRPAWGTSLRKINGRYRLQTHLSYAAIR